MGRELKATLIIAAAIAAAMFIATTAMPAEPKHAPAHDYSARVPKLYQQPITIQQFGRGKRIKTPGKPTVTCMPFGSTVRCKTD